jgi:sarcosine oxidase subunit alpha
MAALTAGRTGARVVLADEDFRLGGRLNGERLTISGEPSAAFAATAADELAALPNVRVLPRTCVFGVYDGGTYGAVERLNDHLAVPPEHQPRQRFWRIVARRAVLAAGAIERPIVFAGNDRPGVMLAGAVRTYLNRFAAIPSRRLVVFTAHDDGWATARDAIAAGVSVEAIIDTRRQVDPAVRVGVDGVRTLLGGRIVEAFGAHGVQAVQAVDADSRSIRIDCDGVAVCGGWNPTIALTNHLGGKPVWRDDLQAFGPGALPPGMGVAGAASGAFTLRGALQTGAEAGLAAAEAAGFAGSLPAIPAAEDEPASGAAYFAVPDAPPKTSFVDHQHDVTAADVGLAHREGYRSVEHLKRYTTLGMATDQGKTANVNGLAIMAELTGRTIQETGTTVLRPPASPVAIGAIAGPHRGKSFKPTRLPPTHPWAKRQGAEFMETGLWLRAAWFPRAGEADWLTAVTREVKTTRTSVGICDVSTLGKIDIQGPDAAALLDFVYSNTMSTLPVGKVRYGLMLREDGFVMDDGTVARLGATHYVITTTTANAVKVMQHLEHVRQVLKPQWRVSLASVTDQWAQVSVAGPKARDVVAAVADAGTDLSTATLPYMGCAPIRLLGGVQGRIFRVSFSGEFAYEVAVPARYGVALIDALMAAATAHGGCAYGLEALNVMRIEKGHVTGAELNGTTTAYDLGLGKMVKSRGDFIGKVMAARPTLMAPTRHRLVGVRPVDRAQRLRAGSHFLPIEGPDTAAFDQGYLTSATYSPDLESWIGLGLIARGPERIGERLRAVDLLRGGDTVVELVDPIFIDREGARLRV